MTAPVGGNRPVAQTTAASSTSSTSLSSSEARTLVDSMIAKEFEARKKSLGETRANAWKEGVTKKMNEYLAKNEGKLTKEGIEGEFKTSDSKETGYQFSNKLRDDAFLKRLQRYMKESLADRWE
ncbi:MAG TPA: hypothetical protein VF815_38710 [Myxococcaceae bacterium]|jgi:hypothetical protein